MCKALGYTNTSKAVGDHLDDDEKQTMLVPRTSNDSLGVETNVINESGLYALVLRSRKPEARKFAKWVTSEVLPAIRKTGSYELPNLYKQQPGDKLSSSQQQQLRGMLDEFVKMLPKDKQGGFMMQGWSKLKAHFGVAYRDIPAERFDEAVSLLTRHVVEHVNPRPIQDQTDRIRVSPQALIENAARIAGQLFGEALKQGALGGSTIDRFLVTADYKSGRCNMEAIKQDACVMSISEISKAITEPGGLMPSDIELISLAGACTTRLATRMAGKQARLAA